ncbi:unnamed protein product [Lactuca virosa]|uniref:Scarecrow-like protein 3 n=1 Tax=Lactuca virosa TaxID=75947 RepID=A0AAU9NS61_9ASTR|nr:unnamed protein product [Lactuca virosa]
MEDAQMAQFSFVNTMTFATLNAKYFQYNVLIPETMLQVVPKDIDVIQIYRKILNPNVRSMSQAMINALEATVGTKRTDDEVTISDSRNEDTTRLKDTGLSSEVNLQSISKPFSEFEFFFICFIGFPIITSDIFSDPFRIFNGLMSGMGQEDGSSSISSSPLHLFSLMSLSPGIGSPYPWLREMESEERGLYLIRLLVACANNVAAGSIENANIELEQINRLSSSDGDTMQRIAAYFTEALANRMLKGWPGLYKAINSTKITSISEEILTKRLFFDLCPFLRLSYLITNQAILEAMEGEKMVHIIDLCSSEPAQWINLLQALRTRSEGPPHLRITGIHQEKEVLEQMALRLNEEAEKLDIPFQFNPIVTRLENLEMEQLRYKSGEALAISSVLQLHTLLAFDDETIKRTQSPSSNRILINSQTLGDFLKKDIVNPFSPSPDSTSSSPLLLNSGKIMSFLNSLWNLSPKLMVVTEQESNHNGFTLMDRALEALIFYAALFDCLESTVPRTSVDRQKVEKMLFGEEIKNIIACEGLERKVRHEKLEKWIPRFELAGFGRVPLSYNGMLVATRLLQNYGYDGYKIKNENGFLVICWHNQPLFTISAWKFGRYS